MSVQGASATLPVSPDKRALAEGKLKRLLRTDPANVDARAELGRLYLRVGLSARAVEELRRVTELEPTRASAYLYLGEALSHLDEFDAALAALKKFTEFQPDNTTAFHRLGILYDRKHQPRLAEVAYRKARELK